MVLLSSESFVFDARPDFPLVLTANRYWNPNSPSSWRNDPAAFTLIFAHGNGFHKEQWEPTIHDLYNLLESANGGRSPKLIREIWAIDAPNHGDSAILNEKVLKLDYEQVFRFEDYARSLCHFLTGFGNGVQTNFADRRLIGVGHSMGASCLLLAQTYSQDLKFESFILVELMSLNRKFTVDLDMARINSSMKRRDIWPSKEEAYKYMKNKRAWSTWDDRVLRTFTDHGLRPLPTLDYPEGEGVTLKCSRVQEMAAYRDWVGIYRPYDNLKVFAKRTPLHLVYGSINDYLSQRLKDDVVNNAAGGLASLNIVPNAGHLLPQANPTGLAKVIAEILALSPSSSAKL